MDVANGSFFKCYIPDDALEKQEIFFQFLPALGGRNDVIQLTFDQQLNVQFHNVFGCMYITITQLQHIYSKIAHLLSKSYICQMKPKQRKRSSIKHFRRINHLFYNAIGMISRQKSITSYLHAVGMKLYYINTHQYIFALDLSFIKSQWLLMNAFPFFYYVFSVKVICTNHFHRKINLQINNLAVWLKPFEYCHLPPAKAGGYFTNYIKYFLEPNSI